MLNAKFLVVNADLHADGSHLHVNNQLNYYLP